MTDLHFSTSANPANPPNPPARVLLSPRSNSHCFRVDCFGLWLEEITNRALFLTLPLPKITISNGKIKA
jgi:hypothetical protein